MRYTFSSSAYWTVVLHAARYPQSAISGVLIGKKSEAGVAITGALALFHTQVLAPMLEIALIQAEAYAKGKGGEVVGWYRANERVEDTSLSVMQSRIASKIFAQFPSACVLMVDNAKLTPGHTRLAVQLLTRTNGDAEWKARADELALDEQSGAAFQVLETMMKEKRYQRLSDFDTHLEDVSKSWLNEKLFD